MNNYILTTETRKQKVQIKAGMQVINGVQTFSKIKVVGYDILLNTFNVYTYPDGYKDYELAETKRIKRVMTY